MGGDPRFDFSRTCFDLLHLDPAHRGEAVQCTCRMVLILHSACGWDNLSRPQKWRASEFPPLLMARLVGSPKALPGSSVIEWKPNIEHASCCKSCSCKILHSDVDLNKVVCTWILCLNAVPIYAAANIYNTLYKALPRPNFLLLANSSCKFEFLTPDRLPSPSKQSSESTGVASTSVQVHNCRNSGSSLPSIASATLSPITGKNLYACPLPPVARKRPSYAG